MERFCDELRWEREQRKVSIEAICEETKISARHLLALEAGEYSELPGGVFRKGILRSYLWRWGWKSHRGSSGSRRVCERAAQEMRIPKAGPNSRRMCAGTGSAARRNRIALDGRGDDDGDADGSGLVCLEVRPAWATALRNTTMTCCRGE